jgi:hypothetical protein
MAGHLYWQSANYTITAFVETQPRRVRVVAAGDFGGSGSAVLRGALHRLGTLLGPIHLDASGVRALSPDAVAALGECDGLVLDAVADSVAPSLAAMATLPPAPVPALKRTA